MSYTLLDCQSNLKMLLYEVYEFIMLNMEDLSQVIPTTISWIKIDYMMIFGTFLLNIKRSTESMVFFNLCPICWSLRFKYSQNTTIFKMILIWSSDTGTSTSLYNAIAKPNKNVGNRFFCH